LFRVERAAGEEQQGIDLPDGAVYPPPAAHLSEMQDELLLERRKRHSQNPVRADISVISEIQITVAVEKAKGRWCDMLNACLGG
jgi:hypothetical protein